MYKLAEPCHPFQLSPGSLWVNKEALGGQGRSMAISLRGLKLPATGQWGEPTELKKDREKLLPNTFQDIQGPDCRIVCE